MAIEIKVLRKGDELILENVAPAVFDNPVDPELTTEFLADPRHHIAVAVDDGLVLHPASITFIRTSLQNCGSMRSDSRRHIGAAD